MKYAIFRIYNDNRYLVVFGVTWKEIYNAMQKLLPDTSKSLIKNDWTIFRKLVCSDWKYCKFKKSFNSEDKFLSWHIKEEKKSIIRMYNATS